MTDMVMTDIAMVDMGSRAHATCLPMDREVLDGPDSMDCGKSACPSMMSCAQDLAAGQTVAIDRNILGGIDERSMDGAVLASLRHEPPARPPRF